MHTSPPSRREPGPVSRYPRSERTSSPHVPARIKSWSLVPVTASCRALARGAGAARGATASAACCRRDRSSPSPACRSRIAPARSRRRDRSTRRLLPPGSRDSRLRRSGLVPFPTCSLSLHVGAVKGVSVRRLRVQPAGARAVVGREDRRASRPVAHAFPGGPRRGLSPTLGRAHLGTAPAARSSHGRLSLLVVDHGDPWGERRGAGETPPFGRSTRTLGRRPRHRP